jgi:hypothetical protein
MLPHLLVFVTLFVVTSNSTHEIIKVQINYMSVGTKGATAVTRKALTTTLFVFSCRNDPENNVASMFSVNMLQTMDAMRGQLPIWFLG